MHCANWRNPDSEYTIISFIWNCNICGKGGTTEQQKIGCQQLELKMDLDRWGPGQDFSGGGGGRVMELFLMMVSVTWPCASENLILSYLGCDWMSSCDQVSTRIEEWRCSQLGKAIGHTLVKMKMVMSYDTATTFLDVYPDAHRVRA